MANEEELTFKRSMGHEIIWAILNVVLKVHVDFQNIELGRVHGTHSAHMPPMCQHAISLLPSHTKDYNSNFNLQI